MSPTGSSIPSSSLMSPTGSSIPRSSLMSPTGSSIPRSSQMSLGIPYGECPRIVQAGNRRVFNGPMRKHFGPLLIKAPSAGNWR